MNKSRFTALLAALALAGCASPNYQPVVNAPPDRAVVYVYTLDSSASIALNDKVLGTLSDHRYFALLTEPGKQTYSIHLNYYSRGGLLGVIADSMVGRKDPEPVTMQVAAGKSYYLKILGVNKEASFFRVDDPTGTQEIQQCHKEQPKH